MAEESIFIGQSVKPEELILRLANRHGLVTGATGTGKTVSLQVLAEGFSRNGVPVFCADVKGDLSGIAEKGGSKPVFEQRAKDIGLEDIGYTSFPVIFWDLFGEQGAPIRATISEMGPLLLSRLMELSEPQEGVLNIAFRIADEEGLLLLDLKDLRALLVNLGERAKELTTEYGNITKSTLGTIQRRLLVLEQQGGAHFFGEPALEIADLMRKDRDGRGYVNVLAADKLMASPRLYATFLLWLLSELFEQMPEVGDPEKPNLVFFFDEAHLLFDEAPKALVDKVEQVVRLIRSKGVGVYFVTQNPLDVPDSISSQLGNRLQHALRAFSPREQKAVKAAATTFRANPKFNTEKAITELGVGEALVSTLDPKGQPTIVQRTLVRPPSGRVGPVTKDERAAIMKQSPVAGEYEQVKDRESAYEILVKRAGGKLDADVGGGAPAGNDSSDDQAREPALRHQDGGYERHGEFRVPSMRRSGSGDDDRPAPQPAPRQPMPRTPPMPRQTQTQAPSRSGYQRQSVTETFIKSIARSAGPMITRAIVRGVLGSLTGRKR